MISKLFTLPFIMNMNIQISEF